MNKTNNQEKNPYTTAEGVKMGRTSRITPKVVPEKVLPPSSLDKEELIYEEGSLQEEIRKDIELIKHRSKIIKQMEKDFKDFEEKHNQFIKNIRKLRWEV